MTKVRVLSATEAADNCCFANECDADPTFAVTTDAGAVVVACDSHVEELVPACDRPPTTPTYHHLPPPSVSDIRELFRVQDALKLVDDEVARRAFGAAPDKRFDPILDSLLDLTDELLPPTNLVAMPRDVHDHLTRGEDPHG